MPGREFWDLIREPFLQAFAKDRLARLSPSQTTLADILMLAGVEFELKGEVAREKIRAMTDEMRGDASWWLWNDLSRVGAEDRAHVDARWREKVQPWLAKAWPREPQFKSPRVGENFALVACATQDAFPQAVAFVQPFLTPSDTGLLLDQLTKTNHPDLHPRPTLALIETALRFDHWYDLGALRAVMDRLQAGDPGLRDDVAYRRIDNHLRATQA